MTQTTLTAADFEMKYDGEHTFPFFENEDATIFAYGHGDPVELVAKVKEYDDLADNDSEAHDPGDVKHIWVTASLHGDLGDEQWYLKSAGVTAETEGAIPVSVIER